MHDVVRVMCEEPARLSRLSHRKGKIALGMDADFVLWDPDEPIVVKQVLLVFISQIKVVFYWDQPFQPQPVWVVSKEHFSNRFPLKRGNSWE